MNLTLTLRIWIFRWTKEEWTGPLSTRQCHWWFLVLTIGRLKFGEWVDREHGRRRRTEAISTMYRVSCSMQRRISLFPIQRTRHWGYGMYQGTILHSHSAEIMTDTGSWLHILDSIYLQRDTIMECWCSNWAENDPRFTICPMTTFITSMKATFDAIISRTEMIRR